MHIPNILARWADNSGFHKRSPQKASAILASLTDPAAATTAVPTTATTPLIAFTTTTAPATTKTDDSQTTLQQTTQQTNQTKQTSSTQAAKSDSDSSSAVTPSSKATNTAASSSARVTSGGVTSNVLVTATSPGQSSTYSAESAPTTSAAKSNNISGGFGQGGGVGLAVGVVVGVVGGFAFIVLAIYFWRRHRRRQHLERLGSMEELARAPSPPLLSRSLTRTNGPRKPIDEDDDDFLTPMDTLPNTHRMDEWHSDEPVQTASYFEEGKEGYHSEDNYPYDYDAQAMPNLPPAFPVPPPAAVVPANGRFYSGEMGSRPGTPGSAGSGGNSSAAIPAYSAMSKYTAFSGGASPAPSSVTAVDNTRSNTAASNPFAGPGMTNETRSTRNGSVGSFSRPGAYRTYE